jgi:hypothetical protein
VREVVRLVPLAALGALIALLVARGCNGSRTESVRNSNSALSARDFTYTLRVGKQPAIAVRAAVGPFATDLPLSLVIDGTRRELTLDRSSFRAEGDTLTDQVVLELDGSTAVSTLTLRVDPATNVLFVSMLSPVASTDHTMALEIEIATEGGAAFVSGVGPVADLGTVSGRIATFEVAPMTLGVTSSAGSLEVSSAPEVEHEPGTPVRILVGSPTIQIGSKASGTIDLRIAPSPSNQSLWGTLYRLLGEDVFPVRGLVKGTGDNATVYGLDSDGAPRILADAKEDGSFTLEVPKGVVEWYAAIDASRTSTPIPFVPGTPWDLRLDVSPGGELRARVVDPDTGKPLTARLLVHGIDGTLDPSFGPDYRASGAGPVMDALRGEVTTPLPRGRYRVAATKGIEWSIDATNVEIPPGRQISIELAPRHVVPTPGVVGADLHVHARPSFDTPVAPEDRVLSLVAAGIDFAVPTEHNIVGDYSSVLAALDLTRDLASVPGVEVTTYSPRFGHFGVFPYRGAVPPYRATTPSALFGAARRGDATRILQVNHPRLPMSIGYFSVFHYEPQSGKPPPPGMRMDFDTLEVFNGYDLAKSDRVEAVLKDWFALLDQGYRFVATGDSDSHRIQYQWAGYPRTLIEAGEAAGDKGPIDVKGVVGALKAGHAIVTNGPVIELTVSGKHPGDEIVTSQETLPVHVVVRAAPWVDVTSLELVAGSQTLKAFPIPSRPTRLGPELGTIGEAEARTVRLDREILLSLGSKNTWVVAVARGTRPLDDILPFMPTVPFAFTNPVWVTRDPAGRLRPASGGGGKRPAK